MNEAKSNKIEQRARDMYEYADPTPDHTPWSELPSWLQGMWLNIAHMKLAQETGYRRRNA